MMAYTWGDFAGQYTYTVTWRGVSVTVECDSEAGDVTRTMLPVRALVNGVDITDLIDIEDGELQELCQSAHDNYAEAA